MRCNRPKPIFGKFQILCGVLIVGVFLGINAISSVEAVAEIGPGDRTFLQNFLDLTSYFADSVFCVGILCRKSSDRYFALAQGVI